MAEPGGIGAVVVAAGAGRRFRAGAGVRKQYHELGGKPLLVWAIEPFLAHDKVLRTVVVLPVEDIVSPPEWLAGFPVTRVAGGPRRSDSVRNGIAALPAECEIVLVHDAARPLVKHALIDRVLAAVDEGGAIPGLPVTDTVKQVAPDGRVERTVDRSRLWRVQTPQAFPLATLRQVHERAQREGFRPSDDAALFERYGLPVRVVKGDPGNIKVTTAVDLIVAEELAHRLPASS